MYVSTRCFTLCASLVSGVLSFVLIGSTFCQSTVIGLPGGNSSQSGSQTSDLLPNNLPSGVIATEKLLAQPIPVNMSGDLLFQDLTNRLRARGIANIVFESARDQGLTGDEPIFIQSNGASIATNLDHLLRDKYECHYTIDRSGIVKIASVDELEEIPFSMMFDVTSLGADPYVLMDNIQQVVGPDSWEDAGGTGRMVLHNNHGKTFLEISNSYQVVHGVRNQLSDLSRMSGASTMVSGKTRRRLVGSTIVSAPGMQSNNYDQRYANANHDRRRGNGGGGGGGFGGGGFGGRGGSGLGGGVF